MDFCTPTARSTTLLAVSVSGALAVAQHLRNFVQYIEDRREGVADLTVMAYRLRLNLTHLMTQGADFVLDTVGAGHVYDLPG